MYDSLLWRIWSSLVNTPVVQTKIADARRKGYVNVELFRYNANQFFDGVVLRQDAAGGAASRMDYLVQGPRKVGAVGVPDPDRHFKVKYGLPSAMAIIAREMGVPRDRIRARDVPAHGFVVVELLL